MATITKPPILDETGQDIVTKLNNINTQVTALNALIADLGLVSITPISQADYDDLSPTDKLNGVFDIYDALEPNIDGHKVSYDSNTDIIQKIDSLSSTITGIKLTNSVGGAETRTATLKYSGNVGILSFNFACQSATSETITFSLPTGWSLVTSGCVIRDSDNGNIINAFTQANTLGTWKHTGTATVGNVLVGAVLCIKS